MTHDRHRAHRPRSRRGARRDPGHDRGVWIDGAPRPAADGETFAVDDPATGATIAEVADAGPTEATAAVDAAAAAARGWAATPPRTRAEVLRRAFELMRRRHRAARRPDHARRTASRCPRRRGEVAYAAEFFRWFSEEAVRTEGEYGASPAGGTRTIVTHRPVGVAALVTPVELPRRDGDPQDRPGAGRRLHRRPQARRRDPADRARDRPSCCTRPASRTAWSTSCRPPTPPRSSRPGSRTRASARSRFTGSTAVGRVLLRQAADRVVNSSMELGGNAPFVVTDDADLDAAVAGAMVAKFRNAGQACTAANRFFVHASVAEEFAARFGAAVEALRVGPAIAEAPRSARWSAPRRSGRRTPPGRRGGGRRRPRGPPGGGTGRTATSSRRPSSPTWPPTRAILERRSSGRSPRSSPGPTRRSCSTGQRHGVRPGRLRLLGIPAATRYASARRSMPAWWASTAASCPTRRRRSAA